MEYLLTARTCWTNSNRKGPVLGGVAKREKGQLEQIDNALRDAYKEVGVSSDKIVIHDDAFNRLLVALNSRIPELQMTPPEIKQRLIGLRKYGGLPKLGVEKTRYTWQEHCLNRSVL